MPKPALIVAGFTVPEELGEPLDLRLGHARDLRRPRRRPVTHAVAEGLEAVHVVAHEGPVDEAALDQRGARPRARWRRRCPAAAAGCSAARSAVSVRRGSIDHDLRAPVHGLLDEGHLVHVRLGRVLAPEDDEAGVREVPGRVRLVGPQGEARGLEAGGPAEVAVGGRAAAEEPPEGRGDAVQQPLRPAGRVEEDGLRLVPERPQPRGDEIERVVPGDALEGPARRASQGVKDPVLRVDALDVAEALQADAPRASRGWPGAPRSAAAARPRRVTRIPQVQ